MYNDEVIKCNSFYNAAQFTQTVTLKKPHNKVYSISFIIVQSVSHIHRRNKKNNVTNLTLCVCLAHRTPI